MTLTISNAEFEAMGMLEKSTGALATDAVFTDSAIIFVVKQGDLGRVIGKKGMNIERLKRLFARDVQVVESAPELKHFVSNLFAPAQVQEVKQNSSGEKKVLMVKVDAKSKGLAIGTRGEKINRARLMLKRHYDIDEVKII